MTTNAPRPESTTFSVSGDSIEEAVQFAIEHLQGVVTESALGGFVAPELLRQSFEVRDGEWVQVYRFRAELLPAVR